MKKILGIILMLLGAISIVGGAMEGSQDDGSAKQVTIEEIEAGKRPAKKREYWTVTGAKPILREGMKGEKYAMVPYASSTKAKWKDIRIVVRFTLRDTPIEEIEKLETLTGVVRDAEAKGALPEGILKKGTGLDKQLIILYHGEGKHTAMASIIIGIVLLVFGALLFRKGAKKPAASD